MGVNARTVYHQDGTRTDSLRDPSTRELTEVTYNANKVVISRRLYLMNERGQVTHGSIFDGAGNMVARAQVFFDEFGRTKEDRLVNLQGEVFQRTIHEYGPDGKPLKPKVINLGVNAPNMKPAMIDFTQGNPAPGSAAPAGTPPVAPPPPPPADEKPKPSFFKKLFQKKEKKDN